MAMASAMEGGAAKLAADSRARVGVVRCGRDDVLGLMPDARSLAVMIAPPATGARRRVVSG